MSTWGTQLSQKEQVLMRLDRSQIIDQLESMLEQEQRVYSRCDYFKNIPSLERQTSADSWCRYKMVQWCYEVIDFVGLSRETVLIAISYLDRFLSSSSQSARRVISSRKEYQLAAMTCLFMAIKMFEPKMIDTTLLVQLGRGSYCAQDFKTMEIDLLFGLNWYLNDPTPIHFIAHYLALLPLQDSYMVGIRHEVIYEYARYQVELALVDYDISVNHTASNIALAALINSLNSIYASHGAQYEGLRMIRFLEALSKRNFQISNICQLSFGLERLHISNKPAVRRRSWPTTSQRQNQANMNEYSTTTTTVMSLNDASPNCVLH